jgi:hypothetical protein
VCTDDERERGPALVEDMLILLLNIVSARQMLGTDFGDTMRLDIAARLAARPMTHSHLADGLSARCTQHDDFDATLRGMTEYKAPTELGNGTYRLRADAWDAYFDPLVVLARTFLRTDVQLAVSGWRAHKGDPHARLPFRIPAPLPPQLARLPGLLHTPATHVAVLGALRGAGAGDHDVLAYVALHVLHLALAYARDQAPVDCGAPVGPFRSNDVAVNARVVYADGAVCTADEMRALARGEAGRGRAEGSILGAVLAIAGRDYLKTSQDYVDTLLALLAKDPANAALIGAYREERAAIQGADVAATESKGMWMRARGGFKK